MTSTATRQRVEFLAEIFPLENDPLNLLGFRLPAITEPEDGIPLSFRFSRQFPEVVVVWYAGYFYVLAAPNVPIPQADDWQTALLRIQAQLSVTSESLINKLRHQSGTFQWIRQPHVAPEVLARLADQVLRVTRPFSSRTVHSEGRVEVKRKADFHAETVTLNQVSHPALSLSVHSGITFDGTLAEYFETHPYRHDPEKLLIGLMVEDIETGSTATIGELAGTIREQRQALQELASGSTSREALESAHPDQPVVAVSFGRTNKTLYRYAMAALRPCVTAETANQLEIDYGSLLKVTKIPHADREALLKQYRQEASQALARYGFRLKSGVNSLSYPELFWQPSDLVEETPILFGNGVTGTIGNILSGLSRGSVYARHPRYTSTAARRHADHQPSVIRIAALNLCNPDLRVDGFLRSAQERLRTYKFESILLNEDYTALSIRDTKDAGARAALDEAIDSLMVVPPDIVFVLLPTSDRGTDEEESGSLYHRIYSRLLRRQIASQVIYEDTLREVQFNYILNQVIPGVLAKLGNLPFVLAEPLEVADCFVGLDVARAVKKRLSGTMNACAGVCIYGKQGEFIRSRSEDAAIEGEEIPQKFLEALLPATDLRGKTVLIYRDGPFCGEEVTNLLKWAAAIGSRFILVECRKSHVPRLYNMLQKVVTDPSNQQRGIGYIAAPNKGLAVCLSPREAILVTTKVGERIGLARPLRLTIRPEGHQVPIEQILDTTLKLTLLHHGALKPPRLPVLLHGADRLADLRLNGVYLSESDRQFWL